MRSYTGRYTFWEGYRNACALMDDERELRFRRSLDAYAFDGEEPDFGDDTTLAMAWELVVANLDKSLKQSQGGRKGREKRAQNEASKVPSKVPNLVNIKEKINIKEKDSAACPTCGGPLYKNDRGEAICFVCNTKEAMA